ncbi:unnamed protein product, partial [Gulo gulo]
RRRRRGCPHARDARRRPCASPRPRPTAGILPRAVGASHLLGIPGRLSTWDAMAVALPGATLPAVVEELLSEMAAAVQGKARSTGRRACAEVHLRLLGSPGLGPRGPTVRHLNLITQWEACLPGRNLEVGIRSTRKHP